MAYANTNGVAMPGVSAGSKNAGAIDTSNAIVSCPSGRACALAAPADIDTRRTDARTILSLRVPIVNLLAEAVD
jgi:hypothetical protein